MKINLDQLVTTMFFEKNFSKMSVEKIAASILNGSQITLTIQ